MRIFVNELSMNNQFNNSIDVINHLTFLMKLRSNNENFGDRFVCPRGISEKVVCNGKTLRQTVLDYRNKDFTAKVLYWLDRSGPFLEYNDDDYGRILCEFNGETIENCVIENVASKIYRNEEAKTYSFDNSSPNFSYTPLKIDYTDDISSGVLHIDNIWNEEQIIRVVNTWVKKPENWPELMEYLNSTFDSLIFHDEIITYLSRHPFSMVISDRVITLMNILNNYVNSHDKNKNRTNLTNEIIRDFFSGDKAPFTNESTTNINEYRKEMTFNINGKTELCSWHGKIKHQEFRIHFQYPFSAKMDKLEVVYIGPKITKR
ncbi:hypothetical protein PEC106664_21870 [Pectobacterium carotovorum subsp. carotovorum]|nr:hypothetical protein PEC106664_21870 [Pectobacterium carotovorum subsp. carotovorum]